MTLKTAKHIFSHLMQESRKRSLTPLEKRSLTLSRQTLRKHAKPVTGNPRKPVLRGRKRKANPRTGRLIYRDITRIEGTKGPDSQYAGQKFFHNFKRPYPEMVGLPDGSLLIRSKKG